MQIIFFSESREPAPHTRFQEETQIQQRMKKLAALSIQKQALTLQKDYHKQFYRFTNFKCLHLSGIRASMCSWSLKSSHFNIRLRQGKKKGCQLFPFWCIILPSRMALGYFTYLGGKTRPFSSWKSCSQPPKRRRRWSDPPVRNNIIHSEMIPITDIGRKQ